MSADITENLGWVTDPDTTAKESLSEAEYRAYISMHRIGREIYANGRVLEVSHNDAMGVASRRLFAMLANGEIDSMFDEEADR